MTTVTFTKINNLIRISAHDHTYEPQMVCNAVSVMMYSLEAWLINNRSLVKKHESDFKAGDAVITIIPDDWEVYSILDFIICGLEQIEHTYGRQLLALNVSKELEEVLGTRFS